jgi:hypothetical protein
LGLDGLSAMDTLNVRRFPFAMPTAHATSRLMRCLLIAALAMPGSVRADDTPEEIAHELAEKMAKAMKRAEEEQRKAIKRAEKRRKEEAEELSEAQEEAREKAQKGTRKASKLAAKSRTDPTEYEEEVLEEMEEGVESYLKLRKRAAKTVAVRAPGPQATAETIVAYQRALADAIRRRRPLAKQGDILLPECHAIFRRIIAAELAGRAGASARMALREGNPPVEIDRDDRMAVRVAVNANYPEAAPVATVPPSVLLSLPDVPEEFVEYRFVNRDLVLRDVGANMIVDFIPRAAPPLTPATPARR